MSDVSSYAEGRARIEAETHAREDVTGDIVARGLDAWRRGDLAATVELLALALTVVGRRIAAKEDHDGTR